MDGEIPLPPQQGLATPGVPAQPPVIKLPDMPSSGGKKMILWALVVIAIVAIVAMLWALKDSYTPGSTLPANSLGGQNNRILTGQKGTSHLVITVNGTIPGITTMQYILTAPQ